MKRKLVLKPWVKATLMLLPEIVIIVQLFFVAQILKEIRDNHINVDNSVVVICEN